jgi:hypothetical protein
MMERDAERPWRQEKEATDSGNRDGDGHDRSGDRVRDRMTLYNRELLGGVVCSRENGAINEKGEMRIRVGGVPVFVSTEVTPEQERATQRYPAPTRYRDWTPIRGSED